MSEIADKHYDYNDGFCCIEDHEHPGWIGKITVDKPCEIENIQPNEPINFFFTFSEKENGSPLKPSKWHVYAEVPFKAGLEKVTICREDNLNECEQEYYRTIPLDNDLQKKHIIDALDKAHDAFEKFFYEKGEQFVPGEDFNRDIYYVDESQIDCPEKKIKLSDLKIYKSNRLV